MVFSIMCLIGLWVGKVIKSVGSCMTLEKNNCSYWQMSFNVLVKASPSSFMRTSEVKFP